MNAISNDTWPAPEIEAVAVAGGLVPKAPAAETMSPYEYFQRALESHIANERAVFDRYRQLAEQSLDPVVRLVMGIIFEDEERHHSIMRQLATRLQDDLAWTHSPEALPVGESPAPSREEYESLRQFVASEETSIRDLREFAKDAEGLYQGVAGALIDMMVLDSQKHEQLLRFLFRRVGEALAERE